MKKASTFALVSLFLAGIAFYLIGNLFGWAAFVLLLLIANVRAASGRQPLPVADQGGWVNLFKAAALLYIVSDLVFVFYLQYHNTIDGDLVEIALPTQLYAQVLKNPLGQDVILHHQKYAGADGYIGYSIVYYYFRAVPEFFRLFASPLDSVYLSCAFFMVLMKALMIYFFSYLVTGKSSIFNSNFLIAAVLMCIMIQTGGYRWYMGIVDPMLISTFAYTRTNFFVVLFFLPFFLEYYHGRKIRHGVLFYTGMTLLAVYNAYNSLSGPMMCVIFAFIMLPMFISNLRRNRQLPVLANIWRSINDLPRHYLVLFFITLAVALFDRHLGKFNAESHVLQVPLSVRYSRLPIGLAEHFSSKGLWMLTLMIAVNVILLFTLKDNPQAKKIRVIMAGVFAFIVIYTLMLPIGGYRFYRPNIIRRDLYSPALVAMVGFYVLSTFFLLRQARLKYRALYVAAVIIPLIHYAIANTHDVPDNSCERAAIGEIVASPEKIVKVRPDCHVMAWWNMTDYRKSKGITDMMNVWGILKEEKYFYQDSAASK